LQSDAGPSVSRYDWTTDWPLLGTVCACVCLLAGLSTAGLIGWRQYAERQATLAWLQNSPVCTTGSQGSRRERATPLSTFSPNPGPILTLGDAAVSHTLASGQTYRLLAQATSVIEVVSGAVAATSRPDAVPTCASGEGSSLISEGDSRDGVVSVRACDGEAVIVGWSGM
jgi:hypothetical protein